MSGFQGLQRHSVFCRVILSLDAVWISVREAAHFSSTCRGCNWFDWVHNGHFQFLWCAQDSLTIQEPIHHSDGTARAGRLCPWVSVPFGAGRSPVCRQKEEGGSSSSSWGFPEEYLCLQVTKYKYKVWAWAELLCAILFATPLGEKNLLVLREFKRSSV